MPRSALRRRQPVANDREHYRDFRHQAGGGQQRKRDYTYYVVLSGVDEVCQLFAYWKDVTYARMVAAIRRNLRASCGPVHNAPWLYS